MWNPLGQIVQPGALGAYAPPAAAPQGWQAGQVGGGFRDWRRSAPEMPNGLPGMFNAKRFARGRMHPRFGDQFANGLPESLTGALAQYQPQWDAYRPQLTDWLAARPGGF